MVLCAVQIFTFRITRAGSPAILKGNEQKSLCATWEQVSKRRWARESCSPRLSPPDPRRPPPRTGWSTLSAAGLPGRAQSRQRVSIPAAPGQHARSQPCGAGNRCRSPCHTGISHSCQFPGTLTFDSGHRDVTVQSTTRPVVTVQERISVPLEVYSETVRKTATTL